MASMKLRVRAASGGPTIRVQIPLLCSLQCLKDLLAPLIFLPTSSFSLSLNKKDEIQGPGATLLSSFGVTSGDLLFYIVNPGRFSSPTQLIGNRSSRVAETATAAAADPAPSREPKAATRSAAGRASAVSIGGVEATPPQTASPSLAGRAVSTPNTRRELCAAAAARRAAVSLPPEQRREQTMVDADSSTLLDEMSIGSDSSNFPRPGAAAAAAAPVVMSPSSIARGVAVPPIELETDGSMAPETLPVGGGGGHRLVPIPDLLQRVLSSEVENIRQASMYLVLAVHAVMLETGFVRGGIGNLSSDSARPGLRVLEGYQLPSGWSGGSLVNLTYTLPELMRVRESSSSATSRELGEEALLRCQIVGNAVVVYGAVTGGGVHRVSLSVSKFLREDIKFRTFSAAGESSSSGVGKQDNETAMQDVELIGGIDLLRQGPLEDGGAQQVSATASKVENDEGDVFRDVFELWKEVKDSLSLPLLTFMCEKAGLPPPPSLLRLPTELKIKVLDSLPSIALANISCACSELRFLAASEERWKQKYREEFGASGERAPGGRGWKSAFVREFEHRKRREEERREAERQFRAEVFPPGLMLRPPSLSPHFGGLDYFQGLGAGPSRGGGFGGGFGADVGGGGGFRSVPFRGLPSGNHGAGFPSDWAAAGRLAAGVGGSYRDLDGGCFRGIDFDGRGGRAWPPENSAIRRGTRSSYGRLDGGGGSSFVLGPGYPRRLDGGEEFEGLGPSS